MVFRRTHRTRVSTGYPKEKHALEACFYLKLHDALEKACSEFPTALSFRIWSPVSYTDSDVHSSEIVPLRLAHLISQIRKCSAQLPNQRRTDFVLMHPESFAARVLSSCLCIYVEITIVGCRLSTEEPQNSGRLLPRTPPENKHLSHCFLKGTSSI